MFTHPPSTVSVPASRMNSSDTGPETNATYACASQSVSVFAPTNNTNTVTVASIAPEPDTVAVEPIAPEPAFFSPDVPDWALPPSQAVQESVWASILARTANKLLKTSEDSVSVSASPSPSAMPMSMGDTMISSFSVANGNANQASADAAGAVDHCTGKKRARE